MKKCILFLLLLQINFSLHSMVLTENDKIKGEESAHYVHETIEIHKRLLDMYQSRPDIEELKGAIEIIPQSIKTMQVCPQSTYSYLQEGSKTWHQIKKIFHGPFWARIKEQHEKLHELYVLTSNNAYKKIGAKYSTSVQKSLSSLWSITTANMRQSDQEYSKKIAAIRLFFIAKYFAELQKDPSNTYQVLNHLETMNWFGHNNNKNREDISLCDISIGQLQFYYNKIKCPGILDQN